MPSTMPFGKSSVACQSVSTGPPMRPMLGVATNSVFFFFLPVEDKSIKSYNPSLQINAVFPSSNPVSVPGPVFLADTAPFERPQLSLTRCFWNYLPRYKVWAPPMRGGLKTPFEKWGKPLLRVFHKFALFLHQSLVINLKSFFLQWSLIVQCRQIRIGLYTTPV